MDERLKEIKNQNTEWVDKRNVDAPGVCIERLWKFDRCCIEVTLWQEVGDYELKKSAQ